MPWRRFGRTWQPISAMCKASEVRNIVLVGFMGAGKSSVGLELARLTGLRLVDLDRLIVDRQGRSIKDIFAAEGEGAFRGYETEALCSLSDAAGLVVATGGGVVGRPDNWELMRRMGPVVYLRASWPVLRARIAGCSERPLAAPDRDEDQVESLLRQRLPLYERADLIVDTDHKPIREIAEEIRLEIKNRWQTCWKG
jgi:shikimate kinase